MLCLYIQIYLHTYIHTCMHISPTNTPPCCCPRASVFVHPLAAAHALRYLYIHACISQQGGVFVSIFTLYIHACILLYTYMHASCVIHTCMHISPAHEAHGQQQGGVFVSITFVPVNQVNCVPAEAREQQGGGAYICIFVVMYIIC